MRIKSEFSHTKVFLMSMIPYKVPEGVDLDDKRQIKDLMEYLRV